MAEPATLSSETAIVVIPQHPPVQQDLPGRSVESEGRHLSRAECEAWIAGHDEARLGFDTGRGHRSVVVGYAIHLDEVLLLLPEYHPATGFLAGSPVTLDVEASRTDGQWETVHATGVAYPGDAAEVEQLHPYGATWPPGIATHAVHVPLAQVEGFIRAA